MSPALEAHLLACEGCRAELLALRRTLAVADDALRDLLSAVPSPELPVRIRGAVSESAPIVHGWRPGFALALVGAVAAVLMAVVLVWQRQLPAPATTVATQTFPAPTPVEVRTPAAAGTSPVRRGGSPRAVTAPEVLVPPGELEALLRYAAHLRRRTLAPDALLAADHSVPLPEPKYAAIQPLAIVPLDPEETAGIE